MLNVRRWFVVVVRVRIYFSILKFDFILTAIYGYHTGRTYELIDPQVYVHSIFQLLYVQLAGQQ